jgi:hypothetical protein
MKISQLIKELEEAERTYGDVECLIEVTVDVGQHEMVPAEELSYEEREGYGPSIAFLS